MKIKTVISTIIATILIGSFANAQEAQQDHLWKFKYNSKEVTIGMYGGLTGSYFNLSGENAGLLSYQAGVVINKKYGFGIAGSGLAYDGQMNDLVSDGTYHMNSGWTGGYIERMFNISPRVRASLMWQAGQGIFFYRYDFDYRADKLWHEEIIDGDDYFVNKPAVKVHFKIADKWWIGAEAAYSLASPVKVIQTDDMLMRGASYGISLCYGIF